MSHPLRLRLILMAVTVLLLLTSCNADWLTGSAQELTGGNGAGLSEYQE